MLKNPVFLPGNLVRHAHSVETETTAIVADCRCGGDKSLLLSFAMRGGIENIKIPNVHIGNRADRLWETTCFEVFLRRKGVKAYSEINLSPSTDWSVFQFDSYRENRRDDPDADISATNIQKSKDRLLIKTRVTLPSLAEAALQDYQIGLSAIIEDRAGAKSFWALAHPSGAPDFHHDDCFTGAITENNPQ